MTESAGAIIQQMMRAAVAPTSGLQAFVTGLSTRTVTLDGVDARLTVAGDGRSATLRSPRIRRGRRYKVRVSGPVTDAAGRRLRKVVRSVRAR